MARSDPHSTDGHAGAMQALLATDDLLGRLLGGADEAVSARRRAAIPDGAAAIVEPAYGSVTQSARARDKGWLLRFQAGRPGGNDWLHGQAGSDEPLKHLSIRFPNKEAALRYAQRHGLSFELREPSRRSHPMPPKAAGDQQPTSWLCCWPTGPHALCCGRYPILHGREAEASSGEGANHRPS